MSAALTTPREQWIAAINEGCDSLTLLAYADWLEEAGDETARAWRWFAETDSRPHFDGTPRVWLWYSSSNDAAQFRASRRGSAQSHNPRWRSQANAILPLQDSVGRGEPEFPVWHEHHTPFASYEAAARALCEAYPNTEIPRP